MAIIYVHVLVVHNPRAAHVHELCQMFEMLRHLGGQDHVYDRLTNLFVRLPFQILRELHVKSLCPLEQKLVDKIFRGDSLERYSRCRPTTTT